MNMKKKGSLFIGIAAVVIAAVILAWTWFFSGSGSVYYYTQIDNGRLTQVTQNGVIDLTGNGGMDYSYTLPAYDESGHARDITFGVSRQLRESAFLRLTFQPGRGVMDWAEVQYDELPPAVQGFYTAPQGD